MLQYETKILEYLEKNKSSISENLKTYEGIINQNFLSLRTKINNYFSEFHSMRQLIDKFPTENQPILNEN